MTEDWTTRGVYVPYTENEERFILEHAGAPSTEIAEALGRSAHGIRKKRQRMTKKAGGAQESKSAKDEKATAMEQAMAQVRREIEEAIRAAERQTESSVAASIAAAGAAIDRMAAGQKELADAFIQFAASSPEWLDDLRREIDRLASAGRAKPAKVGGGAMLLGAAVGFAGGVAACAIGYLLYSA